MFSDALLALTAPRHAAMRPDETRDETEITTAHPSLSTAVTVRSRYDKKSLVGATGYCPG